MLAQLQLPANANPRRPWWWFSDWVPTTHERHELSLGLCDPGLGCYRMKQRMGLSLFPLLKLKKKKVEKIMIIKNYNLGADIVIHWFKLPLAILTSHIWVPVSILASPLLIQLPANMPGKGTEDGKFLGPCWPHGKPGWSSWPLASVWPSLSCYCHLGNKLDEGRFLSLSLSLCLSNK